MDSGKDKFQRDNQQIRLRDGISQQAGFNALKILDHHLFFDNVSSSTNNLIESANEQRQELIIGEMKTDNANNSIAINLSDEDMRLIPSILVSTDIIGPTNKASSM
ncbi:8305_t:CDS:2 [Dentiscutata erythropus]|uniref:8305_t:CDS:1 n=1 Tax=Dentiscutata erythropus TaxID=1348616 RepID=A0A9N9HKH7_9GLOM|nr:8305_t:CDS:2 [Dentiscutata erythropus]